MIRFEKERNFVKIYVEGTNGYYAFDISTGQVLGKKGSPLKQMPLACDIKVALSETQSNLYQMIRYIIHWEGNSTYKYSRYVNSLLGAEKIDALNIPNFKANCDIYALINDNFDAFIRYYKKAVEEHTQIDSRWSNNFGAFLEWERAKEKLGKYAEFITPEMYNSMTSYGRREYSIEEWGVIAYYLVRGKMWEYHNHTTDRLIDYFAKCRYMNKTPEKSNNFMREWYETTKTYELRKTEYDTARMLASYNLHQKAFEFAYGNYVVVIPSVPNDIIDEGQNMHHCVGGYMNGVVEGKDYIVFVRHKDTPNKCYITCEVYTDGRIGQYFLAHDRYINSAEDIEFYNAFAKHLEENW